jgi:exonuclease VII large subunit
MVEVRGRVEGLSLRISSLYRRGAEGRLRMLEYMIRSSAFPAIEHRLEREELRWADIIVRLEGWCERRLACARDGIDALLARLDASISNRIHGYEGIISARMERVSPLEPWTRILVNRESVERISRIMKMLIASGMEIKRVALSERLRMLDGLHPLTVLRRGYTFCTEPEGDRIITRTGDVARGDGMMVHFHDGRALCTVERTRKGGSWRRKRDSRKQ